MTIVGFNFTKINAEKRNAGGKINISSNVTIKTVEESKLNFGNKTQTPLVFNFEFVCKYEPDVGHIMLEGEVISLENEKSAKEVVKLWKKDKKKVAPEIMQPVFNTILSRSNIEAVILSRDMNLPSPIPLPKVESKQPKAEDYIG
jgi:hypothetical protein